MIKDTENKIILRSQEAWAESPQSVHPDAPPLFSLQSGEASPENLCLWDNLIEFALNRCLCLLHLLMQAAGGPGIWGRASRTCRRKTCLLVLSVKAVKLSPRLWASQNPTVQAGRSKGPKYKLSTMIQHRPLLPFLFSSSTYKSCSQIYSCQAVSSPEPRPARSLLHLQAGTVPGTQHPLNKHTHSRLRKRPPLRRLLTAVCALLHFFLLVPLSEGSTWCHLLKVTP